MRNGEKEGEAQGRKTRTHMQKTIYLLGVSKAAMAKIVRRKKNRQKLDALL